MTGHVRCVCVYISFHDQLSSATDMMTSGMKIWQVQFSNMGHNQPIIHTQGFANLSDGAFKIIIRLSQFIMVIRCIT
jgi:hypothetical protein